MSATRPLPRLLIVDYLPARQAIRLAAEGKAEICAEAGDGDEAIAAAQRTDPDICIIRMGIARGGIDTIDQICRAAPAVRVVVIAGRPDPHELLAAIRAGAIGYLPETIEQSALARVVDAVAAGEAAVPRSMVIDLARELQRATSSEDLLTAREAEVLSLLRGGASTAVIAERLSISPITVRRHISTLTHKLGVTSRAELVGEGNPEEHVRVGRANGPLGALA